MALKQDVKESDIILCTVTGIENTVVFVKTQQGMKGSIVMSEVAAGRIRNLREYVLLNKKIVCKVLKVFPDHLELSLRRVTGKEKEEAIDREKKEKSLFSLLKGTIKDSSMVIDKITAKYDLAEFYDELRSNTQLISEFLKKEESDKFIALLKEKEEAEKKAKSTIILKTMSQSGLEDIMSILSPIQDTSIKYLGSAQYSLEVTAKDFKEANAKLDAIIKGIEQSAKLKKVHFELKESKK